MKKTVGYIFFSFILSFLFMFSGAKVSASEEFWNITKDFSVIKNKEDNGTKYTFDESDGKDEDYNYNFSYDYMIQTDQAIVANGVRVTKFFGVHGSLTVTYTNVQDFWHPYADYFSAYKYNYITHEFDYKICAPDKDSDGTCSLEEPGVYRLKTTGRDDGNSRDVYILIQNKVHSHSLETISINQEDKTIFVRLNVADPRNMTTCGEVSAKVGNYVANVVTGSCNITYIEGSKGRYKVEMTIEIPQKYTEVDKEVLKIDFSSGNVATNQFEYLDALTYDVEAPTIGEYINYANKEYEDIAKVTFKNDDVATITSKSVATFILYDPNSIKEAKVNGRNCHVENVNDGELSRYQYANITCEIDSDLDKERLDYTWSDVYGNAGAHTQGVNYDTTLFPSEYTLAHFVFLNDNGVDVTIDESVEGFEDFYKVCMYYGDVSYLNRATCISSLTYSSKITSQYHYNGDITIVAMDDTGNVEVVKFEDVSFANGYKEDDFTFSVDSNGELVITDNYEDLVQIACGANSTCKSSAKVYAKYGEYNELVANQVTEEVKLPTYLEMLNKKFKDNTCALGACDRQVEVKVVYKVGTIEQSISAYYYYVDNNPQIRNTQDHPFEINDTVVLEYKGFNISSDAIIQSLYGDRLSVNLVSRDNPTIVIYRGVVSPVFVSYTDRNGNVTLIDNQPFNYIASVDGFGYYLLECRVLLQYDVLNEKEIEDEVYGKSFFVKVELKDSIKPTLSLLGDAEVSVKQYDVYKDAGTKCSDLSECRVVVKYYLNDETNEVEEIDTSVAGKYIIKYVAIDGDGNESFPTYRYVEVVTVANLDTTSIIIIATVIGAFALFVIFGIINIKKKSKRSNEE